MAQMSLADIQNSIVAVVEQVKQFGQMAASQGAAVEPECSAYSVEKYIFEEVLKLGKTMMMAYFEELGKGDCGFRIKHGDQQMVRKISKPISLLSIFGPIEVQRWLYYSKGIPGYSPAQDAANLPDREASHFVQQMIGRLGIRDTYEEAACFIEEYFSVSLSTHTVHEVIEEISVDHQEFAQQMPIPAPEPDQTIQVVSFDGKGVPVIKDAPAKQAARLKKGQKRNRKKEAMVGIEYVAAPVRRSAKLLARTLVEPEKLTDQELEEIRNNRKDKQIYYQASLHAGRAGMIDEIAERAQRRQEISPHPLASVCLIDGATSLVRAAEARFPEAEIILDIIHVCERFWTAAHVFHKEGSAKAAEMAHDLLLRTLQGEIGRVIGGLRQRATKHKKHLSEEKLKRLNGAITYLSNNQRHMRYDEYLEKGYPIATGAVESACGHLVKDRMEKSGARWSTDGAEAVLRLRSIYANKQWENYLSFHHKKEHERKYTLPYAA